MPTASPARGIMAENREDAPQQKRYTRDDEEDRGRSHPRRAGPCHQLRDAGDRDVIKRRRDQKHQADKSDRRVILRIDEPRHNCSP